VVFAKYDKQLPTNDEVFEKINLKTNLFVGQCSPFGKKWNSTSRRIVTKSTNNQQIFLR